MTMNVCQKLQLLRFASFKSQDVASGNFDVTFDFGDKKLYAHKIMIESVSTTFASMISERWTPKNQQIPIETHSCEDFYQLLSFVYFGECRLSDANIFAMTDLAEFYQVPYMKEMCEIQLKKIRCCEENAFQLLDISYKYSLDELKKSIETYVKLHATSVIKSDKLLDISRNLLMEIIKILQKEMAPEIIFEMVYKWVEHRAMKNKAMNKSYIYDKEAGAPLPESATEVIFDFLPLFNFSQMDTKFLTDFVVGKSIFPAGPELNAILTKSFQYNNRVVKIRVVDRTGSALLGTYSGNGNVCEHIEKLDKEFSTFAYSDYAYWRTSRQYRPYRNMLKIDDGIDWYLVYDSRNYLTLKRKNEIGERDYVVTQMFGESRFQFDNRCVAHIS